MNKKQLKFAADTIASIADHLDMPEAQGNCFALISSRESNMVHAITTDNNRDELIDMFASALQADDELTAIVTESLIRAIGDKAIAEVEDFGEENTDSTDPRAAKYWDPFESTSKGLPRAQIFREFTEEDQLLFWQVEDAIRDLASEGVFKLMDLMKHDSMKGFTRAEVSNMIERCNCERIKGCPITFDAAQSIFILR